MIRPGQDEAAQAGADDSRAAPDDAVGDQARSILRDQAFVRLWVGTTASGLATWAFPFVLGLGVIHRDLTTAGLGYLVAARTAGFVAAVPIGGLLADRRGTIGVIRAAGVLSALASPILALTAGRHLAPAVIAAAAMGMGQGACRPAFQAHVPRVVDDEHRQQANAWITLAVRLTTLLGPSLAVLLARGLSFRALVLAVGGMWLVAALTPCRGEAPIQPTRARAHVVREFVDGFREARRHRWFLAGLTALAPIIAFGYSVTTIVLPTVSREHYGGETLFAAATTAYTCGAVGGAVLMARWRPRNAGWVAFAGIGAYTLAPLMALLLPHPAIVVASYVVIGVGMEMFNVPWFTATQREVPPDRLARVSSIDFLVSYGLAPLGLAFYPWLIDEFGRSTTLTATAVICLLAPLLAASSPGGRWLAEPRTGARRTGSRTTMARCGGALD